MTTEDQMVEKVKELGVADPRVIQAMRSVDRAEFVPGEYKMEAYEDRPLPIGYGQTISQPYTVARMIELLMQKMKGKIEEARVLEVGTGSGWETGILAKLFGQVFSVELVAELAARADKAIGKLGVKKVRIRVGDGKQGWKKFAPFEGVIVTANAAEMPEELIEQLQEGGVIVIPVAGTMRRGVKTGGKMEWEEHGGYSFVPLL